MKTNIPVVERIKNIVEAIELIQNPSLAEHVRIRNESLETILNLFNQGFYSLNETIDRIQYQHLSNLCGLNDIEMARAELARRIIPLSWNVNCKTSDG